MLVGFPRSLDDCHLRVVSPGAVALSICTERDKDVRQVSKTQFTISVNSDSDAFCITLQDTTVLP